jgi:23S rRNA U2552 (ribose-2'-O)-methylase RlmE/FtsJ
MIFVLLPSIHKINIFDRLKITSSPEKPLPFMLYSLNHYLTEIKGKISDCGDEWNTNKKYTNPYEYIYTNSPRTSVCRYKPISRAYFKMIEILNTFQFPAFDSTAPLEMFALAEGPGGFIEAVSNYRNNPADMYYGMTIEDPTDIEVPGWKKTANFLRAHPNVLLEKGADLTGNILNVDNFKHVIAKYKNKCELVTGDGGFDFSTDFNSQEINITRLLFGQIAYAVCIQKKGGCFVLKCFDCFYKATAELIYLLSTMYEKVYVVKPNTSRYANSERYLVCINFLHSDNKQYAHIFEKMLTTICDVNESANFIRSFFNSLKIPLFYYSKLEECSSIIGQIQIDNIYTTLALIENRYKTDKINFYIKTNIQKCIKWCIKNNMDYNDNVFLVENKEKNIFKSLPIANEKMHSFQLSDYE